MMSCEKFKKIIEALENYRKKRQKISSFFEDELMDGSFCVLTIGCELEDIIMNLLADEFECHFKWPSGAESNDIEWWFYEAPSDHKTLTVDGKEVDVTEIEDFYNYLITSKEGKDGK